MAIVPNAKGENLPDPDVLHCQRCNLAATRTQVVPGGGNPQARVMVVGEAPGRAEDKTGIGFQGAAGRWFDDVLGAVGLSRADIWLTNAVRCRPVEGRRNRAPRPEEIDTCRFWLDRDLARINPKVVVTLGKVAFRAFTGESEPVLGQALCWHDRILFPLYHPAYLIYRPQIREAYAKDLMVLGAELDHLGIARRPQPTRLSLGAGHE